jgi:hypothetical protein
MCDRGLASRAVLTARFGSIKAFGSELFRAVIVTALSLGTTSATVAVIASAETAMIASAEGAVTTSAETAVVA